MQEDVTGLLHAWRGGEEQALDQLMPAVYDELYRLAAYRMRGERLGHTLETGGLVNEAFVRLVDQKRTNWRDRAHFFAIASRVMRRVLVDHARKKHAAKRGGPQRTITLVSGIMGDDDDGADGLDLVALDAALQKLAADDPRRSKLVELRFFGGLTVKETAEVLDISQATVARDWNYARAWLYREIGAASPGATLGEGS